MINNLPNELIVIILEKIDFYPLLKISDNTRENINYKNIYEILKYCKNIVLVSLSDKNKYPTKNQDFQDGTVNKLVIDNDEKTSILIRKIRRKLAVKKDESDPEMKWEMTQKGWSGREYIESYTKNWIENLSKEWRVNDLTIIEKEKIEEKHAKIDQLLLFRFSHTKSVIITLLLNDYIFSRSFNTLEYGKLFFRENGNILHVGLMHIIPGKIKSFPIFRENSPIIEKWYDLEYERMKENRPWKRVYNCQSYHQYKNTMDFNIKILTFFTNSGASVHREWIIGNFSENSPKIQYTLDPYILSEISNFRRKTMKKPEFSKIDFT